MKNKRTTLIQTIAIGILSSTQIAVATENVSIKESESVIVTATRTSQTTNETLAPVIIITQDEIEQSAGADIVDLIRMHAGIEITRNGGPGQGTSIFIRGTESDHTQVMIDGVRINPGTAGGASIQMIRPSMIERIEIVKGPRSTLYGTDAIGGVINIITKKGTVQPQYRISAGYGSNQASNVTVSVYQKSETGGAGITLNKYRTNGIPVFSTSNIDRGHDNINAHLYFQQQLDWLNVEFNHWQAQGNTEYMSTPATLADQDHNNSTSILGFSRNLNNDWYSKLTFSHVIDDIVQNQGSDYVHTQRNVTDWQNDISINENNLLTAGISISRENTNASTWGTIYDNQTDVDSLYIQDEITLNKHSILVGGRHIDHKTFGNHTTGNIEYGYNFTDQWRIIASGGTGFRAPSSADRFGFGGNPYLEPEKSRNTELSLRYLTKENDSIYTNIFKNRISNLIEYNLDTSSMQNMGNADIEGIEVGYQLRRGPWRLLAEAIFQDPKNIDGNTQLLRRAKRSLTLNASYNHTAYSVAAGLLSSGKRQGISNTVLPGYTLVNLSGNIKFQKGFELTGRIENLFDKDYILANYNATTAYRTPERALFIEIAYKLN